MVTPFTSGGNSAVFELPLVFKIMIASRVMKKKGI
jgi:hypothetical protein